MQRVMIKSSIFSMCLCALVCAEAETVANNSFETPALAADSFQYDPNGASWLFVQNSGIINAPGDGFASQNAPNGNQYAFLQSAAAGNGNGAFSQSIHFDLAGSYQLSFMVAGRPNNGNGAAGTLSYQIQLDSTVIGTDATTTAQAFTARSFNFVTTVGDHTLIFDIPGTVGTDETAFFDVVSIQAVPEPAIAALLLAGLVGVAAFARRPKT